MSHASEAHRHNDQLDDLCTRIAPASAGLLTAVCLSERANSLKSFHGHVAGDRPINLPRLNGHVSLMRFHPPCAA